MPMNEKEYKEMIGLLNELETMLENPQADGIDFEKMFGQILMMIINIHKRLTNSVLASFLICFLDNFKSGQGLSDEDSPLAGSERCPCPNMFFCFLVFNPILIIMDRNIY